MTPLPSPELPDPPGFVAPLLAALDAGPNALLIAPPGAGKTTAVPPALLGAAWRAGGRILVLEPRRLAARAAAARVAFLRGEPVGETIGFSTRLDRAVCARTRVEFITEGLLLRRMLADPGLHGVACVVFDEVHERGVEAELGLALCLDLQRQWRPELRLVAMSATPDADRLAALLAAPVIRTEGRLYPVTIEQAARDIAHPREIGPAVARAVRAALAAHEGDILAFLPGMGEIRAAQAVLEGVAALVLPLHGDLPPAEQDRALTQVAGQRRIVLATSIAETSLTVPGVRVVVDGGWRRAPRLDPATGLSRLTALRISRAAAEQRAGRAGREAPGVAIRLWTPATQRGMAPADRPEILETELSGLVLACAEWGTPPGDLAFLDPPPAGRLDAATTLLEQLGGFAGGGLTELGRRMARLGAHPRLAAMMLAARDAGEAAMAADLAALIEERDPLRGRDAPADLRLRLAALRGESVGEVDRAALSRIRAAAGQYRRRLTGLPDAIAPADPGRLVAAGFADRIAQGRGEPGSFRLAGGGSARMPAEDGLAREPLLAVAAIEQAGAARIRLACPLDPAALPGAVAARITETIESGLEPRTGTVLSRRRRRLGALVLEDRILPADPDAKAVVLARALADRPALLGWTDAARQIQARAAVFAQLEPGCPDISDAAIAAAAGAALLPWLGAVTRLSDAAALDMAAVLRGMLGAATMAAMDRALPPAIALPGGRAGVDYAEPVPVASARAQAFYGLDATPVLGSGRVGLRLALLSPAGRPIAVTADLAGFWRGGWTDVRREMRGRYPRHAWPERPWEEPPLPRPRRREK